jgi:hypothetical protein
MLTKEDIFVVQVSDKMILDAVHYAEKSLHYTYNRMGSAKPYDRVRNIVKGLVMEAAFKRLLEFHQVHFDLYGNTHWTKKDRYDVGIDGHKFDIKGFHIGESWKAEAIRKDRGWLLDCCALVPSDQIVTKSLKDDDYYVFPFLVGEFERGADHVVHHDWSYFIHVFWDFAWIKNKTWCNRGTLRIESKSEETVHFRLGGQGQDQELIIEEFDLKPMAVVSTKNEYYTVLFTQTSKLPQGEILIVCDGNEKTEIIDVTSWENIWVYSGIVCFTGYITKAEFRKRSVEIPRFFKECKQYGETKTVNRKMMVQDLNPLNILLPKNCKKFVSTETGSHNS